MAARAWLITGINSGFGRLMTEQLLAAGDRVAGTVRDEASVADLKEQYGDRLWVARLDMTDGAAIAPVVDRAFADLGRIDVVINNAGYGLFGAAEELADEQIVHQIDTNLVGPIRLVRAALPHLRAQGGGRVIALSSLAGQVAVPGASLYHASKWGLEGFFEAIADELAPFDIGVTIIEPGGAQTGFRQHGSSGLPPPHPAYADNPANAIRTRTFSPSSRPPCGDPARMAAAIIASVDSHPAPLRLALGSDSYGAIENALTKRLANLQAKKDIAFSTDLTAS